ncbi:MAG: hypothetical protein ACYTFW_23865 [Planctomycetota bacterium]|jgi:hypothetical protein
MLEFGSIQNTDHSEHSTKPTQNGISNSTKSTAKIKIADNDPAAVVIRNPLHTQTGYIQQDSRNTNPLSSQQGEFGLEQILDIEQNMTKQNVNSEIGRFSPERIHEEAFKALRCQGNLETERVLHLLKDDVTKQNKATVTEQSFAPPGQNVSIQSSERV